MSLKLSIIIPCYNCDQTLGEAVDSCYMQGFPEDEFEIVMVDDGSTDGTRSLMQEIEKEHSNIKIIYHNENQGGGAARNTAVANVSSESIFCLDSDDILYEDALKKMLNHLHKNNCDGVGIHKSIKFKGTDIHDIECTHIFNRVNEKIEIGDLFQTDGMCSLYSTFMFTKSAFKKAGGYPTEHGFDTQGFAWRFLISGLHAETCADAIYLHRIEFNNSYYLRESASGLVNFNWQSILIENLKIFNDEAQRFIITFKCSNFTRNIFAELVQKGIILTTDPDQQIVNLPIIKVKSISRNSFMGYLLRIKSYAETVLKKNHTIKQFFLYMYHINEDIISRFKSLHSIQLLWYYLILQTKKIFKRDFIDECPDESEKIDLIIPTIGKDFPIFKTYITHLRNNICGEIDNIYVIAPNTETPLKEFCIEQGLIFIDEVSVLGYGKNAISYTVNSVNRSGWLFQQLLKLAGDTIVENKKFISICSDTILISKHNFIENGKDIFFETNEWHEEYFITFKKLFGYTAPHKLSLTSHMMVFDTERLLEMKKEIEKTHNTSWDQAYIACCNKNVSSGISDYETYAQWILYNYPNEVTTKPFYNRSFKRSIFREVLANLPKYQKKFKSISFHSHS